MATLNYFGTQQAGFPIFRTSEDFIVDIVQGLLQLKWTMDYLEWLINSNHCKCYLPHVIFGLTDYSELPLIWTPEMRPPLYSDLFKMSQNTKSTLKWGHPSNQDSWTGPRVAD